MPLNVLVTAGSRRVPLVRAFQRALKRLAPGGAVVVSDVNALSPAVYTADRSYEAPLSSAAGYLDAIEAICKREHIDLIIPTIDDELTLFARAVDRFARRGIRVAVSPAETTVLCNDKYFTSRALRARGINAVETLLPIELSANPAFPLFIKPRFGRGSVGAFPVRSARELEFFRDYVSQPVVQSFLDGPEFTIDVLCDFDGEALSVVPRERVVVRAGVVDRGRTVADPALIELGLACTRAMRFIGAINLQCRMVQLTAESPAVPVIFEINPRFSGGIPLTIASGADFPAMLIELALDRPVESAIGKFREHVWMTSYETSMFMDESYIGFSAEPRRKKLEVA